MLKLEAMCCWPRLVFTIIVESGATTVVWMVANDLIKRFGHQVLGFWLSIRFNHILVVAQKNPHNQNRCSPGAREHALVGPAKSDQFVITNCA